MAFSFWWKIKLCTSTYSIWQILSLNLLNLDHVVSLTKPVYLKHLITVVISFYSSNSGRLLLKRAVLAIDISTFFIALMNWSDLQFGKICLNPVCSTVSLYCGLELYATVIANDPSNATFKVYSHISFVFRV